MQLAKKEHILKDYYVERERVVENRYVLHYMKLKMKKEWAILKKKKDLIPS